MVKLTQAGNARCQLQCVYADELPRIRPRQRTRRCLRVAAPVSWLHTPGARHLGRLSGPGHIQTVPGTSFRHGWQVSRCSRRGCPRGRLAKGQRPKIDGIYVYKVCDYFIFINQFNWLFTYTVVECFVRSQFQYKHYF